MSSKIEVVCADLTRSITELDKIEHVSKQNVCDVATNIRRDIMPVIRAATAGSDMVCQWLAGNPLSIWMFANEQQEARKAPHPDEKLKLEVTQLRVQLDESNKQVEELKAKYTKVLEEKARLQEELIEKQKAITVGDARIAHFEARQENPSIPEFSEVVREEIQERSGGHRDEEPQKETLLDPPADIQPPGQIEATQPTQKHFDSTIESNNTLDGPWTPPSMMASFLASKPKAPEDDALMKTVSVDSEEAIKWTDWVECRLEQMQATLNSRPIHTACAGKNEFCAWLLSFFSRNWNDHDGGHLGTGGSSAFLGQKGASKG